MKISEAILLAILDVILVIDAAVLGWFSCYCQHMTLEDKTAYAYATTIEGMSKEEFLAGEFISDVKAFVFD